MPSREKLETALRNAHKAGDTEAARRLATALKTGDYYGQGQQPQGQPGTSPDNYRTTAALSGMMGINPSATRFMQGVGNAVTGDARETEATRALPELASEVGARQFGMGPLDSSALLTATDPNEITQIVTAQNPDIKVQYNKDAQGNIYPILYNPQNNARAIVNKPGMTGIDVMQTLGIGAAFFPTGKGLSALGVGAKMGGMQAAMEAGQAASGGEFNPGQVALAAGLGAGGKKLEDVVSAGARMSRAGPASQIDDTVRAADEAGIPLYTSDVRPPETFAAKTLQQTGEKIPFFGTGSMRRGQQEARERAVGALAQKYDDFSYSAIVGSLKNRKDSVKRAAGNVLQKVGEKADDLGEVGIDNSRRAIDSARKALNKTNVIGSDDAIRKLDEITEALDQPQTFTSLKENRSAFREIIEKVDPTGKSQLPSRAKALLQNVERALGRDMDEAAKKALTPKEFAQWKRANAIYRDEAIRLKKSRIKNILDRGDITPEAVEGMLFSRKPSEVQSLYNGLTQAGRNNAKAAIISKAVQNISRRKDGLSPNAFATELKKFGPQLNIFFKGADRKQLLGLQRALEATRRAQDASATTATGQQLYGAIYGLLGGGGAYGLATNPAATGLAAGGIATVGSTARILESRPVRDALIKLGSVPRNSTQFEQALAQANQAFLAAAQAAREKSADTQQPPPPLQ